MPLNSVEQNIISKAFQAAETLRVLKGTLDEINYFYNGAPNFKNIIVQGDLDLISSYGGITKADLDNVMAALTGTVYTDINAAYNNLMLGSPRS